MTERRPGSLSSPAFVVLFFTLAGLGNFLLLGQFDPTITAGNGNDHPGGLGILQLEKVEKELASLQKDIRAVERGQQTILQTLEKAAEENKKAQKEDFYKLLGEKQDLALKSLERKIDTEEKERLADGCYHIYLDVGANIGVHTRFLFEPNQYPRAKTAHRIFEREFGKDRDNRDICSFGFEPNPNHSHRHRQLESAYNKMGWRYHFVQGAASDENGNLTMCHQGDEKKKEWGFSTICDPKHKKEFVPTIRISEWLNDEVFGRQR